MTEEKKKKKKDEIKKTKFAGGKDRQKEIEKYWKEKRG